MDHLCNVYDDAAPFIIDPATRTIENPLRKKVLAQGDHNSERLTFELPRYVDGHDMSECESVHIHYTNTSRGGEEPRAGVYEVDLSELKSGPIDDGIVTFSWLISGNATAFVGSLEFSITFACVDDSSGLLGYSWSTTTFGDIEIVPRINHGDEVIDVPQFDVLAQQAEKVNRKLAYYDELAECFVIHRNLFDVGASTQGTRLDIKTGDLEEANGWVTTGYIPHYHVGGECSYIVSSDHSREGYGDELLYAHMYDDSYNHLGFVPTSNVIGKPLTFNDGEEPYNRAAFIRFSFAESATNVQIERGSAPTAYEPHQRSYIRPDLIVTDDALSETSTNPVQNQAVSAELHLIDDKLYTLARKIVDVDDALSDTSTNPVQNKVIMKALADTAPLKFTVTKDETGSRYTSSKTYHELIDAIDEGRTVICVYGTYELPLTTYVRDFAVIFASTVGGVIWEVTISSTGIVIVRHDALGIKIGDQVWGVDEEEWDVDFTETINDMIDEKVKEIDIDPTGGDPSLLIVTLDIASGASRASHSPVEIFNHVEAGGYAVAKYTGSHFALTGSSRTEARFSSADRESTTEVVINRDKTWVATHAANTLVVTLHEDGTASHYSEAIYEHVDLGGTVVATDGRRWYTLTDSAEQISTFTSLAADGTLYSVLINASMVVPTSSPPKVIRDTDIKIINVRDLGAVGDGEEDDTKAIQDALHKAERTGQPLYFPAGNYKVSKTITTYTRDGDPDKQSKALNIYGAGMGTVFTTTEDFEGDYVFHIDVAEAQPRSLWVHDFAIDLVADVSGIYFNEIGMKSVIENLWITHLYDKDPDDTNHRAGIYCRMATVTTFQRIKIYGNRKRIGQGHENIGIVCKGSWSTKFIDCDIIFCKWAIYINSGSNNSIETCRIDENEYGIYQNSTADTINYMPETRAYPADSLIEEPFRGTFCNLIIRGNRFEGNNQQAIFLAAYSTGDKHYMYNVQVVIAHNYFDHLGADIAFQTSSREVFRKAIHLYQCKGVVIEDNAFKGAPYDGSNDEALLQNIAGDRVEDITIRGNVAVTWPQAKANPNDPTVVLKTSTKLAPQFLALTGFVDDLEADQSTRGSVGDVDAALDRIIAIQEGLIGGEGE